MMPISFITHSCRSSSSSRNTSSAAERRAATLYRGEAYQFRQIQNPQPTWGPGVKQDVEVTFGVLSGPADAEGRHHRDVHVILPHDAIWQRSDADGDDVFGVVYDAAFPAGPTLLVGKDGDVGALAVVGVGTWMNRRLLAVFKLATERRMRRALLTDDKLQGELVLFGIVGAIEGELDMELLPPTHDEKGGVVKHGPVLLLVHLT